jgi:hypothetical protein
MVTTLFGAACGADGEVARTETDPMPSVVTVTATDYGFEAPDTLQEGWTTFHLVNNGGVLHTAQLVKLKEGQTLDGFREAYAEALENDGPWNTLGLIGGTAAPLPGQSINATLHLEAGHYAWYCPFRSEDGVPYVLGHQMARPFVVTQRGASAPQPVAPEANVTITMVDYAFLLSAPLSAGTNVIRVENQGPEPHEVLLMKLAPGKSVEDMRTYLEADDFQSPGPLSSSLGGVVVEAVGGEAYFQAELTSGDYVLFCTLTAPDGRRHWEHGMLMPVRVD